MSDQPSEKVPQTRFVTLVIDEKEWPRVERMLVTFGEAVKVTDSYVRPTFNAGTDDPNRAKGMDF